MAASTVTLAKHFDASLLQFDAVPGRNSSGGKFIKMTYGPKKQILRLQTPTIHLPFGISCFTDTDKGTTTESLDASLRGWDDPSSPVYALHRVLKAIDEALLAAAELNSEAWFGKKMSRAILEEFQRSLIKLPREEGKYPPMFKSKIVKEFKTGQPPRVYDADDKATVQEVAYITNGSTAKLLVTFPSVYLISKTFGISPRLSQAVVVSRPASEDGCQLLKDEDEQNQGGVEQQRPTDAEDDVFRD